MPTPKPSQEVWVAIPVKGKCAATINLKHGDGYGRQVARVGDCGRGRTTALENARVMAASRELLGAARKAVAEMEEAGFGFAEYELRAAIAKATGT